MQLSNETNQAAYRRYAPIYDVMFGSLFSPGRRRVVELMAAGYDDHVLEVGVGTGLSLPLHSGQTRITGIDISDSMLLRARQRISCQGIKNVSLLQMDAQSLAFSDNCMTKVALMYVASVVPDPNKLFSEAKRVCRSGGDIFILNHFSSENSLFRWIESSLDRFSSHLGFTPVFSADMFFRDEEVELIHMEKTNLFSYWTIFHFRKR